MPRDKKPQINVHHDSRWGTNVVIADFGARRRQELREASLTDSTDSRTMTRQADAWAAHRLMAALVERCDSGRLSRGREYYRAGNVVQVTIGRNRINGVVSGTQLEPFDVKIRLAAIPAKLRQAVEEQLLAEESTLRALLRGDAPGEEVEDILWNPQQAVACRCTCPDKAEVCKHAVAVGYEVCGMLTHTPEQILRLRGIAVEPLLEQIHHYSGRGSGGQGSRGRGVTGTNVVQLEQQERKNQASVQPTLPKNMSQQEFWGDPDTPVTWEPMQWDSGRERGDTQALMDALRTVSWTGVDQLQASHELEQCYDTLKENEHMFYNPPWCNAE